MATWLNPPPSTYAYDAPVFGVGSDLPGLVSQVLSFLTSFTGVSMFATGQTADSAGSKLIPVLVLGYLFNIVRRLVMWFLRRFRFQYYITAQFTEGDPTYDWLVLLLTDEGVWKNSKDFRVSSKTSQRKWSIGLTKDSNGKKGGSGERGVHSDVRCSSAVALGWILDRSDPVPRPGSAHERVQPSWSKEYRRLQPLPDHLPRLMCKSCPDSWKRHEPNTRKLAGRMCWCIQWTRYGPVMTWNNVKRKNRRPMESIILAEGVLDSITKDAREFINMEEWYLDAGIPHRRGYLLHGPPGTGKTSTIYALAGELGMEIYSLSLASNFVDDNQPSPKNSIFLIEDIDCAFPSREDEDDDRNREWGNDGTGWVYDARVPPRRGSRWCPWESEEGKLFFATTNYIDHLDPALMRPGRIDMKIQYHLANKMQAAALFKRFFPTKHVKLFDIPSNVLSLIDHPLPSGAIDTDANSEKTQEAKDAEKDAAISTYLADLAESFSKGVPESEFSTAELQGYLLIHKREPLKAASCVGEWVASERKLREDKKKRDEEKKAKMKAKAQEMWGAGPMGGGAFGGMRPSAPFTPPLPPPIPVVPVAARSGDLPLLPTPDLDKQGLTLPVSESSGSLVVV
ncbi:P-loop containing nucleoside triphosphate hydrolase protein [Coprinellus micaceus]|uniref:P-loop containing nucleoside triphosphate hydrolase protein n=1 Tax=Coprinellus micaceus TaxID=71717 RepID=A0A4Y7SAJ0_COPMI|nr:P-loop containing nucleoside triphosphate hydrolase protein [Coprinellus micaceus]